MAIDFQSNPAQRRSITIQNISAIETDVVGQVNGVIDYVHIFYHQSRMGMMRTSNPLGIENFAIRAWYR